MNELYEKFTAHRQKLRDKENKNTPSGIIADAPLKALARSKPTTLDDMQKITGIGKAFCAKYGQGFLDIILADLKPTKLTMMRKEARETLKSLQSRLTNLNKRNRMLYLPKITSGRVNDLFSGGCAGADVVEVLLSGKGSVKLCDSLSGDYTAYNRLIRASRSTARETGTNMLYVGYPFAVGRCGTTSAFNVAAPLVLFPVALENKNGNIVLEFDRTRDVTYNNALLLCNSKFNGKGASTVPSCAIDEVSKRDFIKDVSSFYSANGIKIAASDGRPEKFFSYTEKTFPKLAANTYQIRHVAAVGVFPMYSGALQKDFDDIIDAGVMPAPVAALLEGAGDIDDFYGSSVELVESNVPLDSEARVDYINELNVSQERAIEFAQSEPALVMQGPPGTGKSQTITSMISDAVCKNKNVLVVSQKRAALSVIYSRLAKLSRYCMFIDDPKDKEAFYGRLRLMFDAKEAPAPYNQVALNRAVSAIDEDIDGLEKVSAALTSTDYGAPLLQIYKENFDNEFMRGERERIRQTIELSAIYRRNVPDQLLSCGYEEIKAARVYLDDAELLETLREYYELSERYGWLMEFKRNLSGSAIAILVSELDKILDEYAYGHGRFKFRRAVKAFVKANFTKYTRALYKAFRKDPVNLYNGVKAYETFFEAKITADSLNFATKLYFGTLVNLAAETGKPLGELNGELKEYCGYAIIDKFETDNRDTLSRITNYTSIVSRIVQGIDKKRDLTRDRTLSVLKTAFNTHMVESKRRGEMMRAIDGQRRQSPSKFVDKFKFELFRGVRVYLMTPEAVSELLPLENGLFDLLVFDEASQIYVERGVPAIARAKRIVVCGDHKQLRPSSLGDGRITPDDDDDDMLAEEESLLDIARFKFPEVMLSYHYRSRYEELIAFSNAAFYGGRLNTSPNPTPPRESPVRVYKVNGVWEDRVNRAEAQKTLELIKKHLRGNGERETLGVITFNALQRDCILDLIDKACDADPEFKTRYTAESNRKRDGEDVGLFIKNIENVQGDERDRIIFSFAYAYNPKGVMSRNFGWLNRPGGENRLNVAISRAKRHIDIVTSIIPSDLRVDDIKSVGVHVLRKYLDYAYCVSDGDRVNAKAVLDSFNTELPKTAPIFGDVKSVLCERVAKLLSDKGVILEREVGMGCYKLDLAVKDKAGNYLLGIECDDAAYSDESAARERDVMRRRFLQSRGWKLYRVWSSDFYHDPDAVVADILNKAQGAVV